MRFITSSHFNTLRSIRGSGNIIARYLELRVFKTLVDQFVFYYPDWIDDFDTVELVIKDIIDDVFKLSKHNNTDHRAFSADLHALAETVNDRAKLQLFGNTWVGAPPYRLVYAHVVNSLHVKTLYNLVLPRLPLATRATYTRQSHHVLDAW
jgi:hypothetical protein